MRLPHSNATVTAISAKAFSADWDDGGTVSGAYWTGRADAYLTDERHNDYLNGSSTLVVTRSLIVPSELAVNVEDTLTVLWGGQTITATVRGILRQNPPPGIPAAVATSVLEIEFG